MKREEKGQISLELVLLTGFLLLLVVITIPALLKTNELNRGLAAARDGASYGATLRGMGFVGEGVGPNDEGVIRIENLTYQVSSDSGLDGRDSVEIWIHVRGPSHLNTASVRSTIRTQTRRYVAHVLHGDWIAGASVSNESLSGTYYTFAPIHMLQTDWTDT
jgi:hypothetical protein